MLQLYDKESFPHFSYFYVRLNARSWANKSPPTSLLREHGSHWNLDRHNLWLILYIPIYNYAFHWQAL